jgi:hypothetical protein
MANLNEFISEFKNGIQRNNRFRCFIDVPASIVDGTDGLPLSTKYPNAARLLQRGLVCSNTSLPNRRFETTEQTIYGFSVNYPIGVTYGDLDCTFMAPLFGDTTGTGVPDLGTQRNEILDFFHAWQNLIQDHRDNRALVLRFPDEYRIAEGFKLVTYNDQNEGSTMIQFFNVYPLTVSQATLDWAQTDFLTFSVTFSYTHWNNIDGRSGLTSARVIG